MREKLQIKLLRVTVFRIKLSLKFSLNDHTGSYITVLIERESGVTTVMRGAGDESDTDELTGRRDDISLQGMATTITAAREVEEDVTMRAVLPRLITAATFNLAFLTVMKAAAASQRHLLLTRKHQNKFLIISQE
ncbi:uncharacterized protein BDCG_01127 [Blastomyces dermatitidis ER-3]|uniref:Uncharacterized protein n=1 Tax=Ajellomyces dermatitidis (strain ER-3 / ATCC MYA-2586) TaxID=559297 RepID=A0ABP2EM30_AJEDR|nr:uncharacterized protein BDCG_01127 [Blastomyces dermatitidis ER-3]EEQ84322.1 hypothetical protein BDCG_01127 [Blastomyces dermatitidis ER-3]